MIVCNKAHSNIFLSCEKVKKKKKKTNVSSNMINVLLYIK